MTEDFVCKGDNSRQYFSKVFKTNVHGSKGIKSLSKSPMFKVKQASWPTKVVRV